MHIRPDSLIDELQRMAPEIQVGGGSFVHWLPPLREIPLKERERLLMATQRKATGKCLTDLVVSLGLPAVEPTRLPSGARNWPEGYTGSVSHKGTKVVAAIASTDHMRSIGIDIERLDSKGFPTIAGLDANEFPCAVSDSDGQLIVFSVKEAVYKALNPIFGLPLDFTDVALSWCTTGSVCSSGVARACGVTLDVRFSVAIPSWVVSAALWPAMEAHSLKSGNSLTIGQKV